MMGGRAAEEMVFHDPTTGAGNDIEKATNLARAMVTQYGMTERLGAVKLGEGNAEPFLGRDIGHSRNYSEDVAAMVDDEVKKLVASRTRRPSTSSRRTATSSTPWSSRCWTRRPSTRSRSPRSSRPLRRRPGAPGLDRLARAQPLVDPAGRDPAGDPRPGARPTGAATTTRSPRAASSSRLRGRAATSTATRASTAASALSRPRLRPAERIGPSTRSPTPSPARTRCPAVRPRARRGRRPRAARSPSARTPTREGLRDTPARVARAYAELTAGLRQAPRGRAHHHLRPRPRRDGAGPRHRAVVDVRAPPGAVHRRRARRLHPRRDAARSPGCPSWPAWSTSTPSARRCRSG